MTRLLAEASLALLRAEKAFLLNPQMSVNSLRFCSEHPPRLPTSQPVPTTALRPAPHQCQLSCLILLPGSKKHTVCSAWTALPSGLLHPKNSSPSLRLSSGVTSSRKPSLMPPVDSEPPCFPSIHGLRYRGANIAYLKTCTNKQPLVINNQPCTVCPSWQCTDPCTWIKQ